VQHRGIGNTTVPIEFLRPSGVQQCMFQAPNPLQRENQLLPVRNMELPKKCGNIDLNTDWSNFCPAVERETGEKNVEFA